MIGINRRGKITKKREGNNMKILNTEVKWLSIILIGMAITLGFIEIAHNRVVEIECNEVLENE